MDFLLSVYIWGPSLLGFVCFWHAQKKPSVVLKYIVAFFPALFGVLLAIFISYAEEYLLVCPGDIKHLKGCLWHGHALPWWPEMAWFPLMLGGLFVGVPVTLGCFVSVISQRLKKRKTPQP